MNLNNVILTVYNTSRSNDVISVQGSFELTGIRRNNRLQIYDINTQQRYWVKKETLNKPIIKVVEKIHPISY